MAAVCGGLAELRSAGRRLEAAQPAGQIQAEPRLSPWAPDFRQRRPTTAAATRRSLLQLAVCASAARSGRVSAATFQAPSVSFLPPSSSTAAPREEPVRTVAPKPHTGPPVFVQATGRIVASEWVLQALALALPVPQPSAAVSACSRRACQAAMV